jgi:hypothetical protein
MKRNTVANTHAGDRPATRSAPRDEAELIQRIIATPAFARSPLLTRFLLYVCERRAEGREEEITEYQIGIHAIGRPTSYSPGEDNIVRNYARLLRKRLEEYFAGEGRHEPLRVLIPRGSYVPVFEPNSASPGDESVQPADPAPELTAPAGDRSPSSRPRLGLPFGILIAALAVAALGWWGIRSRAPHLYDVFWREVFQSRRAVYLVPGDSGFVMLQDITGADLHLNDYISGDLEKKFPGFHIDTRGNGSYGVDRFSNYTSTADLAIAVGVAGRAQQYGGQLRVQYARDLHLEDLKSSNVILLGGPHANPWVELFEPESNFHMQFTMQLVGMHTDERLFINKHPRAGEQSSYANQAGRESHLTYALVSFLPSADGAGRALLIEGENMAGTHAAGDFILDPASMEPVLADARLRDGGIGPFEILLEARTVGANAPKARIAVQRFGFARKHE